MSCLSALAFVACTSLVKKADIPVTANPKDEISKLEADIQSAVAENIDVLASDDFKKSKKWLSRAKSGIESKDQQDEILDSLRQGRGYLTQAYSTAAGRASKASGLFESR